MNTKRFIVLLFLAIIFLAASTGTARPPPRKAWENFYVLNVTDPTVQQYGVFAVSEYNKKASPTSHLEFIRVLNATELQILQYTSNHYELDVTNIKLEAKNCSQPDQSGGSLYFAQLYAGNQLPQFLNIFVMSDNSNL